MKSRFTEEQIVKALQRLKNGLKQNDLARERGISIATIQVWKKKYNDMNVRRLGRTNQKNVVSSFSPPKDFGPKGFLKEICRRKSYDSMNPEGPGALATETCKLNHVNPRVYLQNLVKDLLEGKNPYTPKEFKDLSAS